MNEKFISVQHISGRGRGGRKRGLFRVDGPCRHAGEVLGDRNTELSYHQAHGDVLQEMSLTGVSRMDTLYVLTRNNSTHVESFL